MRYTIFALDDKRQHYTAAIERELLGRWVYRSTKKVNGAHKPSLDEAIAEHGYEINWTDPGPMRVGHLGIWYTVLNSFELAPHVTFEDDALLGPSFLFAWNMRFRELPKDTDFFSLFLPRDSDHLYNESMAVSRRLTRVYQRYGGVSMYYTKRGTEKVRALLERDGITGQYDDALYAYAKAGELNGYCSKPTQSDLVYITGQEKSIVQESEIYERVG